MRQKRDTMRQITFISVLIAVLMPFAATAQMKDFRGFPSEQMKEERSDASSGKDSLPHVIPMMLPKDIFIPSELLFGYTPWNSAPITRPTVLYHPKNGFTGSIGFGQYMLQHPDKFFSTLEGYNSINVPQLFLTRQMILGNTFKLGRNVYYLSGIMYGAQMGVMGNNWGMGAREGFIWNPNSLVSIVIWTQDFQSVTVYTPVMVPDKDGSGAAITMPATPEVFSFGVQANFVAGEFIIGVGTSVAPVPFQKRKHSEFRYK